MLAPSSHGHGTSFQFRARWQTDYDNLSCSHFSTEHESHCFYQPYEIRYSTCCVRPIIVPCSAVLPLLIRHLLLLFTFLAHLVMTLLLHTAMLFLLHSRTKSYLIVSPKPLCLLPCLTKYCYSTGNFSPELRFSTVAPAVQHTLLCSILSLLIK